MLRVHGVSFHPLSHWDTIWYGSHYFQRSLNVERRGTFLFQPPSEKEKIGIHTVIKDDSQECQPTWPGLVPALMLYYGV